MGRAPSPSSVFLNYGTINIYYCLSVQLLHLLILLVMQQVAGLSLVQSHVVPGVEAHWGDSGVDWYGSSFEDDGVHACSDCADEA